MKSIYRTPMGALMQKIQIPILLVIVFTTNIAANSQSLPDSSCGSIAVKQWVRQHFAKGKVPPFSFVYNGKNSDTERSDFMPVDESLEPGKDVYITPSGGRSSDCAALPFFNIEAPGKQGVMVAIGWTGKWYAHVQQTNEKTVSLTSGMEKMKTILYPKEEIRTPGICLLFWNGEDRMIGHNQFRKFVLAHHSRKINGWLAEYPLSGSFDYGDPEPCGEYNCLTTGTTFITNKIQ